LFPKYVPDKILLREISFQTVSTRTIVSLMMNSKKILPSFPLKLGICSLLNSKHARKEAKQ